jgi:phthalate 4,5-dioxygenase oxygenase subunit
MRDDELIRRVSGDAPAAQMMRRYWVPFALDEELHEPDGPPVRVRLFGESLVAFRDTAGSLGLVQEACPHRLASLALGRNEDGGLRCIYHGWKFGRDGRCLEMPTEPAVLRQAQDDRSFASRMRLRSYPVREAGGLVWTYLGPADLEPAFPAFDWTQQPRAQLARMKFVENVNYLQAVEGSIDSAHTRFLHRGSSSIKRAREEELRNALSRDLAPRLEVADTTYGFRYVAIRRPNEDAQKQRYVKITRYVFPTTAITSRPLSSSRPGLVQMFIPVDDEHTLHFSIFHALDGEPVDEDTIRREHALVPGIDLDERFRLRRNEANWWLQDRAAMRNGSWTGISGVMNQDVSVQESMGPIVDHRLEHLGTSDIAIIRLRRKLAEAVRGFLAGEPPPGLDAPLDYARITHVPQLLIGNDERWEDVGTFPGEYAEASVS